VTRQRGLRIALGLNVGLVALQVGFGIAAGSLGLIADAGHNLTDVGAVALSLFAVRLAMRPADSKRSFGYHRSTILAAQANAAAILVISALIAVEGINRLVHPVTVDAALVLPVAAAAVVINLVAAMVLSDHTHDLNMRSAYLHMAADAATSAGVAVAAALILVTNGNDWLDPAISLIIGAVIAVRAVQLLKETASVLLESTPDGIDMTLLGHAITEVDGVEAVHDLHAWSLSSELHALSAHVVLEGHLSLEDAQQVGRRIKATIEPRFDIAHSTLELECEACDDEYHDTHLTSPTAADRSLHRH
jgi:cobalt-zinc-cadmium efflux system protein